MAIERVKKKKKPLKSLRGSGGGSGVETSPLRPKFVEKLPPCGDNCPNHNAIRKMLMTISKASDYQIPVEKAFEDAFYIFLETTPFPSVCGRVCPHPCESECNRKEKEGAVSINKVERYIGDFGLKRNLKPKTLTEEKRQDKIAVVGSGPGGLSCAYQLARRGYPVTVFEAFPKSGGMLRYGIPDYRLPQDVLDAEINRILEMGVELKTNTKVGNDISMEDLAKEYRATFVSIGAHEGIKLRVEGEDADNVFTGTDFLHRVNTGDRVDVGDSVVVIGGGDTAIDAARVARRLGANATILYRRTRKEMPAIEEEIEGALEEGVKIEYLAAPIEIYRNNGVASGMKCQRMKLGEPDASGRQRPVPIDGDTFGLNFSTLIAAISQQPDFTGFEPFIEGRDWIKTDEKFHTKVENAWAGGDNINLGLVIDAVWHGRRAAEAIHEAITNEPMSISPPKLGIIRFDKMKLSHYEASDRLSPTVVSVNERFKSLTTEIESTFTEDEAVHEAKRCMSCGMCFDCGNCWSYCQDNAVIKPMTKGDPYQFKMEFCNGCKKCAENCPCGYIEMH
jgi:NADPH-dependent glutamate synthase beta subunit-like oxidoreductase/Pyruvate/2-oxoacid:ferredoxin oxidoreductase delta subunit